MVGFGSKASMEIGMGPRRRSTRLLALGDKGGPDLISALPDDLLLLVLDRLPCVGAAARTGVLSRRWRGLWARLRQIVLRDVPLHSLEQALARIPPPPPTVSLLKICLPKPRGRVLRRFPNRKKQLAETVRVNSLLHAAARLYPKEFFVVNPSGLRLDLPSFHRTTSIVLDYYSPVLPSGLNYPICLLPAGTEFPALETLSMSRCFFNDFDGLLSRCPRLRALRLTDVYFQTRDLRVNSPLLQELVVAAGWTHHVNIVAPMLTQLTISFRTHKEVNISIFAPMVEKVSWHCRFSTSSSAFCLWQLWRLSLQAADRQGQPPSLHIHAGTSSSYYHRQVASFTQEIEKQLIAAFSVLELHLKTTGHVYGAFVSHVLESNQICCAIQRLKVDVQRSVMEEEEEEGCPPDCSCEPKDWKSQTVALTALEEVEINGFGGKDHDFDLLKVILRSAPMLKRMTMKLSQEALASNDGCRKIYNIFEAYSSVQCYVYLSSGLMHGRDNCPST
uniref:Uncharacterized protein n=1 Tax=Avena sativa TaxID=4498 RepID=A0ACD5YZX3_AVESA